MDWHSLTLLQLSLLVLFGVLKTVREQGQMIEWGVWHRFSLIQLIFCFFFLLKSRPLFLLPCYFCSLLSTKHHPFERWRANSKYSWSETSLVVQWLRIHLPMWGHGFYPRSRKMPHAMKQLNLYTHLLSTHAQDPVLHRSEKPVHRSQRVVPAHY